MMMVFVSSGWFALMITHLQRRIIPMLDPDHSTIATALPAVLRAVSAQKPLCPALREAPRSGFVANWMHAPVDGLIQSRRPTLPLAMKTGAAQVKTR
jgi:hypothetical protein